MEFKVYLFLDISGISLADKLTGQARCQAIMLPGQGGGDFIHQVDNILNLYQLTAPNRVA